MYGEAFVAPTMEKLHLKANPFEVANPDLEPQEIRTLELAYTQELDALQATVTLFQNRETELFTIRQNADESFSTVNAGSNSSRGAELEIAASIGSHVLVRGAFARLFEGERPEAFSTLASLILNFSWRDVTANLNGYWRSGVDALPEQGSYAVVNAALRYRLKGGFAAEAVFKNLLDEDYATYSRNPEHALPNRGREVLVGVRYAF
jgi:outer membrane receptor protein involved in Fe transport